MLLQKKESFYYCSRPIKMVNPIYPIRAKLLRIEGIVTVVYNVDIDGKVSNIRVIYSNPLKIFEGNVRLAMLSWMYVKR